jgi:predicted metal-dependent hydrolase
MSELRPEPQLDAEIVEAILRGVAEFNSRKFFECHDTLEEVWRGTRGPARDFFQGLIQISVGFYHLGNANLSGGKSQLEKGLKNLSGYGEHYLGMELAGLRLSVQAWLDRLCRGEELTGTSADLPKYCYNPPRSTRER